LIFSIGSWVASLLSRLAMTVSAVCETPKAKEPSAHNLYMPARQRGRSGASAARRRLGAQHRNGRETKKSPPPLTLPAKGEGEDAKLQRPKNSYANNLYMPARQRGRSGRLARPAGGPAFVSSAVLARRDKRGAAREAKQSRVITSRGGLRISLTPSSASFNASRRSVVRKSGPGFPSDNATK